MEDKMAFARAEAGLDQNVKSLSAELAGITFGYLGNFERWGDDRSFYIFLPRTAGIGTLDDHVSLGRFADLPKSLSDWPSLEAAARRKYHNGTERV